AVDGWGFSRLGASRQGRPIVGRRFEACERPSANTVARGLNPARGLLLVGGVHGDEPSSVEALLELGRRFSSSAIPHPEVLIIPALNPDGLVVGRKNSASDVDLNRNFPARNFTTAHAPGYNPGPAPLSEPETSFLARIIDEHGIDAVVAVHAPFACVNFDGPALVWADAVAAASGWPVRENIGYPTPGSLGSWLGLDRNLPILTLELPPGPLDGFRAAAAAALESACAAIAPPRSNISDVKPIS
ncbi:MAG: DUF2817 domain-containing protein, partial [Deltaproteobacteria bacterium]|nr:DUF2817 domain-containing protein [Deltaproteobacteria bacterium]